MNTIDLTGQTFGRLTVVGVTDERKNRQVVWRCRCSCGGTHLVTTAELRRRRVRSCGCLGSESSRSRARKHFNNSSFRWDDVEEFLSS